MTIYQFGVSFLTDMLLIDSQSNKGASTGLLQPVLGDATEAGDSQPASMYGNPPAPPMVARDPSALDPWALNEDDDMLGVVGDDELLYGSAYRLRFDQDRGAILDGDEQILG